MIQNTKNINKYYDQSIGQLLWIIFTTQFHDIECLALKREFWRLFRSFPVS